MTATPTAKIIFDAPTSDDAFDGGGHKRSAKALAEGIDQIHQNGGGAIGLEGAWGSGKSSVIQMAEIALKERSANVEDLTAYHIFTFDLWTHQTDEFRRAFLERFLDFMETASFRHDVDLQEERDRIRNRKKEVTNENKHQYTPTGAFIVLLLPLLPIIYAWLNPTAFVNVVSLKLVPLMVLIVTIAGILITLVMIRHHYLQLPSSIRLRQKTLVQKFVRGASEFLTLSKNVKQETSTQWIRDEDPTTVEFQRTFRGILAKAQTGANRIVFVLDNVDRLSKDAAKDAWSEMRALLAGRHDQAPGGNKPQPVVVVVPYDRDIISKALLEASEDGDLFAKTFNRILRVSPPLGSHWVGFLNKELAAAFGGQLENAASYRLHRILQYHFQVKTLQATPRRIIGFVNDLGSYWTQWAGHISVESMAVFVLLRHELEKEFAAPTGPSIDLGGYAKLAKQENLLRDLAALHFNVGPNLAEEVLLTTPLANALAAAAPEPLHKLQQIEGFDRFFPRFLGPSMDNQAEQPLVLANAARNIKSLGLQGALAEDVAAQVAEYIPRIGDFAVTDDTAEDIRSGLLAIVELQPDTSLLQVASTLKRRYEEILTSSSSLDEFTKGLEWARYVPQITAVVEGTAQRKQFWKSAFPGGSPEFALGAAYLIEANADLSYLELSNVPPLPEVVAAMETRVATDARVVADVTKEILPALTTDMRVSIVNAIGGRLRLDVIDEDDAWYLLSACEQIFRVSNYDKPITTALQKLVSDGTILFYAHRNIEAEVKLEEDDTIAAGLYLLTKHYKTSSATPSAEPHPALGPLTTALAWYNATLSKPNVAVTTLQKVGEDVARNNSFGLWLGYAVSLPAGNLFEVVVLAMVSAGQLGHVGSIATGALIRDYDALRERLTEGQLQDLVRAMGAAASSVELLEEGKLFDVPFHLVEHLQSWAPETNLAKLVTRIDAKLRAIGSEEWAASLRAEDVAAQMLISRIGGAQLTLSAGNYLAGYKANALEALSEEASIETPADQWRLLYKAVPKNSRKVLARQIMTDLHRKGATPAGAVRFIQNFPDLAAALPVEDYPETAIQILLRELVLAGNEDANGFVRAHLSAFRGAVKKLTEKGVVHDAVSAFNDVLEGLEQGAEETGRVWAAELRDGLNLPRLTADVTASSSKE